MSCAWLILSLSKALKLKMSQRVSLSVLHVFSIFQMCVCFSLLFNTINNINQHSNNCRSVISSHFSSLRILLPIVHILPMCIYTRSRSLVVFDIFTSCCSSMCILTAYRWMNMWWTNFLFYSSFSISFSFTGRWTNHDGKRERSKSEQIAFAAAVLFVLRINTT